MASKNFDNAKKAKADEFYTQLSDIEKELKNYKAQFKNKVVFCNCDDPETSNFYYYFVSNFDELKLKKLITTHFELDKPSYKLEYYGGADVKGDKETVIKRAIKLGQKTKLKQNFQQGSQADLFEVEPIRSYSGDFRSPECIELLKLSDIVVTNPPFSLFREFVSQLIEYKKKYLIIGNVNAITYKEIFKLIKENKIWLGQSIHSGDREFQVPESYPLKAAGFRIGPNGEHYIRIKGVRWFTNLDYTERHEDLILYKNYDENEYPNFDNYDAINIDVTKDIPMDYAGNMGVPITFLDKYNPEQFEIIALGIVGSVEFSCNKEMEILKDGKPTGKTTMNAKGTLYIKSKDKTKAAFRNVKTGEYYDSIYARILIRNLKPVHNIQRKIFSYCINDSIPLIIFINKLSLELWPYIEFATIAINTFFLIINIIFYKVFN
ncbi:hypothetical protein AGMMS50230_08890 [Spirochaetia bacterium]|nr:hypothetical protein AGMMS50230_08890 [Spirochaetia bacterium]